MGILRRRLARRIANWRAGREKRRAIAPPDDRLLEDAGLPRRSTAPRKQTHLHYPYLDI